MTENQQLNGIGQELKQHALILGGIAALFWGIEIIDWALFSQAMDGLGIQPRTVAGLRGIVLAPFLHVGFGHLLANTMPFLVLGWFVMLRRTRDFVVVSVITMLVSGLGIWLIGPAHSVHVGASGLIFGYFGFLVLRGYFERSLSSLLWAILVIFLYGGMIWGVLPQERGISWQAHLFGFVGGGWAAYLMAERRLELAE